MAWWARRLRADPVAGALRTRQARRRRRLNENALLRLLLARLADVRPGRVAGYHASFTGTVHGVALVISNDLGMTPDDRKQRRSAWQGAGYQVINYSELRRFTWPALK
jgi:hypothetical protein